MPDYSNSVIYIIRTGDGLYVGSTTNFNNRKYHHRVAAKYAPSKLYKTIRDNDGKWDMTPYKKFPCQTKMELTIEEQKIKNELGADLNMYSCHGLDVARVRERKRKYYLDNKEKCLEANRRNYLKRKEKQNE